MSNTLTLYRREMQNYFTSPIAYIFICAFLVVMAIFFFAINGFFQQPSPDLRSYFVGFPLAFAFLIPAVTMRLWSEEKRGGTIEILMTLPVKSWEVVLAKFLAAYTTVAITILLTITTPLAVSYTLDLDAGVIVTSYIGAFLLAGVYVAVGAWASSLTQNQIVALLVAMVSLFVLWGVGLPQVTEFLSQNIARWFGTTLAWFGTFYHYLDFIKGLLDPVHVVYALALTVFFLILNNFTVEWRKY